MATAEDLRKIRSSKRGRVTKKVNELQRLAVEDTYSEVILNFDIVTGYFREFEEAQDKYHEKLTDETAMLDSEKYFEEVESNYIASLKNVLEYIQHNSKVTHMGPLQGGKTTSDGNHVSYVKLPPVPQPDVFSGKSEMYPMWKASFNTGKPFRNFPIFFIRSE